MHSPMLIPHALAVGTDTLCVTNRYTGCRSARPGACGSGAPFAAVAADSPIIRGPPTEQLISATVTACRDGRMVVVAYVPQKVWSTRSCSAGGSAYGAKAG